MRRATSLDALPPSLTGRYTTCASCGLSASSCGTRLVSMQATLDSCLCVRLSRSSHPFLSRHFCCAASPMLACCVMRHLFSPLSNLLYIVLFLAFCQYHMPSISMLGCDWSILGGHLSLLRGMLCDKTCTLVARRRLEYRSELGCGSSTSQAEPADQRMGLLQEG
jgi:hypothetical protein